MAAPKGFGLQSITIGNCHARGEFCGTLLHADLYDMAAAYLFQFRTTHSLMATNAWAVAGYLFLALNSLRLATFSRF